MGVMGVLFFLYIATKMPFLGYLWVSAGTLNTFKYIGLLLFAIFALRAVLGKTK
jgi:hypothetical protein